jgi:hypothetical protein
MAETQPQLKPALLRLSAMISQYFMGNHRSICGYGGHWMNFPSGENPGFVIVTDVEERVLSCMTRVEETLTPNSYNRLFLQL